jgi:AraC-like DNA-binding protein
MQSGAEYRKSPRYRLPPNDFGAKFNIVLPRIELASYGSRRSASNDGVDAARRHQRAKMAVVETPSEGKPSARTMMRVVAAAGMSARTFQRQLEEERTSFSELLADVRRSETLRRPKERSVTIAAIATNTVKRRPPALGGADERAEHVFDHCGKPPFSPSPRS